MGEPIETTLGKYKMSLLNNIASQKKLGRKTNTEGRISNTKRKQQPLSYCKQYLFCKTSSNNIMEGDGDGCLLTRS